MTAAPRYIGIMGKIEVGKSTVQGILERRYGIKPIDDGRPLRDAAMALFGLTEWHVSTPSGKASHVTVCGQRVQVRDLLGWLGKQMEARFGDQFMPEAAVKYADRVGLGNAPAFSFGSCRMDQGKTYLAGGGIVLEVVGRRGKDSPYDFDTYNAALATHRVANDGTEEDLEAALAEIFDGIYPMRAEPQHKLLFPDVV